MTLVFPSIKVPKSRLRQKVINKLSKTIKLLGVFDDHITLKLPDDVPASFSSLKMVLDDSRIHFTLE